MVLAIRIPWRAHHPFNADSHRSVAGPNIFRTTILKTVNRVRSARERLLDHEYLLAHVPARLLEWGLHPAWRGDRRVLLADRARTVIDILDATRLGGGIREATEILAAYLNEHDWKILIEYGDKLGNHTVFKRLGYLVETAALGNSELLSACRERMSAGVSLLEPGPPAHGTRVGKWNIRANVQVVPPGAS
ncbi:MAG: type IV toxin-antitoxin system AbiEi family antitoxin domain-containing protein [bacterium]